LATARLKVALFVALLHSRRLRRSSSGSSKVSATLTAMREMISSGRWSQVPPAAILFASSMVLHSGKVEGKWKGRNASVDEMGSPSWLFMHVYIWEADVAKHRPKRLFGSRELLAHNWRNHSPSVHQFVLRDVL
jgi:hypothetical protein